MARIVKSGLGWRIGWNPEAEEFKGLVGTDNWAIELTQAELNDFSRLLTQLADTMQELAAQLMDEEKITCEAESDLLWMEVSGYPHKYNLRCVFHRGRRAECEWEPDAVVNLVQGMRMLDVF
jgi:hypothetical protein